MTWCVTYLDDQARMITCMPGWIAKDVQELLQIIGREFVPPGTAGLIIEPELDEEIS